MPTVCRVRLGNAAFNSQWLGLPRALGAQRPVIADTSNPVLRYHQGREPRVVGGMGGGVARLFARLRRE